MAPPETSIDYHEWRPCAALNGVILAYWRVAGDGTSVPSPAILPDAFVEIVINLGGAVTLEGPAITGSQPARAVVGLLDTAIDMRYPPEVSTFGSALISCSIGAGAAVAPRPTFRWDE